MKQITMRKVVLSLMAVVTLMMVAGSLTPSFAQWPWERGRTNDRSNDRNNDRYEDRNNRRSRDQQDRDVYDNDRNGNNRGGYGNNRGGNDGYGNNRRNGGFYNEEQEKGYRDGLRRGQEDRQTNRIPDPNNSSHFRKGNADYRLGFRRGYDDSYPTNYGNNNRRRW